MADELVQPQPPAEPAASADPGDTQAEPVLQPQEITPLKPIRVAWLAGPETFNHIGRILHPLAIGLMDEVIGVSIFIPEGCDQREVPNLPVDVVPYARLQWLVFKTHALPDLATDIENRQVDLLHALDSSAADLAKRLSAVLHKPYVVSCYQLGDGKRLGTLGEQAQAVFAASDPIRRDLLAHNVIAPERIHLVRPGVYQVSHATCFIDSQKSIAVVAGGEMTDFIAYEAVLKAFNEVRARNYDCAFFIIANGKEEDRIRLAAERMGLNQRLTFVQRQQAAQLQGILKAADIYISPIASTRVDIASLLAMAAGDPVLAARSQTDDFFIDGRTAVLFNSGSAPELTTKLISLLSDRQKATSLVESSLAYLRDNHSAARMVADIARIYRAAVEAPQLQHA